MFVEPSVAATQDKEQPPKRDRVAAVGPKKVQGAHQQVFALVVLMGTVFLN